MLIGITIAGGIRRHFLLVSQAFPVDFSQAVVPTFVEQQSRNQSGFGSGAWRGGVSKARPKGSLK